MRDSTSTVRFYAPLPALCLLALISFVVPAQANPAGGAVTNGSAAITSSGNTETITQSTQNAVINWQSFDVGANQTTKFVQPDAGATTLNRVNAGNPSQILGTLDATGNVILINPNGVFFGKGSQVDVNGLVATTANISSQNFMQGNRNFNQPGNPNAQVINQGTITAGQAGLVGLVAPTVINDGTINAKLGHVDLGAGDTFTLYTYGDGLITLGVSDAVKQQLIQNSGTINATGGTIALTAGAGRNVVNSLIAVPGKLNAPTASMQNGEIDITNAAPNGQVQVSGALNAAGPARGQTAGLINITGSQVGINSGAVVDASGYSGGGTVNIGGNLHGQGPLMNAQSTLVDTGATVKANSITQGNGGEAVVWSNQQTTVKGQIEAQGGPNGGNGGFVETSSHGLLDVETPADVAAPHGKNGTWLLDPASLTISNGSDADIAGCPSCTPDGLVVTSNLTPATIEAALNAGTNVTITTGGDAAANTGDITVVNSITATGAGSLTLSSYRNIIVDAGITLTGGALVLQADNQGNGSGYINIAAAINTNGGNITMGGGIGSITAGAGFATGNAGQGTGIVVSGIAVNAGGGNIIINGQGFNTTTNGNFGVEVNGGGISTTGAGTISVSGLGSGNTNSGSDYGVYLTGGAIVSSVNGSLTVNGTGGSATGSNNYGVEIDSTIQTSGSGSITLTGLGGGSGAGGGDYGIFINGGTVTSTSAGGGGITLIGYGGDVVGSGGSNFGIYTTGAITSVDGAIIIDGNTGISGRSATTDTGGGDIGVFNAGTISSAGNASITLTAIGGGTGAGGFDPGIFINGGTVTSTGAGSITLIGYGGDVGGSGGNNYGVFINSGQVSGVDGAIVIDGNTGIGGQSVTTDTGGGDIGVFINGTISSAGNAAITLTGIGGSGGSDYGIFINGGTVASTAAGGGSITLIGYGGDAGGSGGNNYGVYNGGQVSSVDGAILIDGNTGISGQSVTTDAGGNNIGILTNGTISSAGNASITLNGIGGGSGTGNYGLYITGGGSTIETTGSGNITIAATGATGNNAGVYIDTGASIQAPGTGTITVQGTGGAGTGTSGGDGVQILGAISGGGGSVSVISPDAGTGAGTGIEVSGGSIRNTGSGVITLSAAGGSGGGSNVYGVEVDSGGVITAANGTVTASGTGGVTGGGSNYGVYLTGAGSTIETSGSGAISVSGTGGDAGNGTSFNYGVYITTVNGIQATGSGAITVTGAGRMTGGGSGQNEGVELNGGSITGNGGLITVTAMGGYSSDAANIVSGSSISNTNGNIIYNGTAMAGGADYGLWLQDSVISTTGSGTITVTGQGGPGGGTNYGVLLDSGGVISAVNGAVSVSGTGGTGAPGDNYGVYIMGAGSTIQTTGSGAIGVTGIGGDAGGTSADNYGVYVTSVNGIQASGGGNITVSGMGGSTGGNGNIGLYVSGGSIAASGAGTITLSGLGQGTGNSANDSGVQIDGGGGVSAANGNLAVTSATGGGAGTGTGNYGLYVIGADSSLQTTGSGNITVTGMAGTGAASTGVDVVNANGIQTTGTGNITVNTDSMTLTAANNINSAANLTVQPVTNGTTIGVGTGGGTLLVNDADLTWGQTLTIGNATAGNMDINPTASFANPAVFQAGAGNVTLDGTLTSTSASTGATLLLDAGGNFINNVGAAALNPGSGRWLSYSTNPALDTDNGLTANFRRFSCVYQSACPTFPAAGDGFLYSETPLLTATPTQIAVTYGSATPSLTGYAYTLSGYLGGDAGSDSVTGSLNGTTPYTAASTVAGGSYAINYNSGALASALGYGFAYANNAAGIVVNPAALTITAKNATMVYGNSSLPALGVTYSGFVNGETAANLTTTPTVTTTATVYNGTAGSGSNVGSYPVTASGAVDSNYAITYVNGTLQVMPYTLDVTANALSKIYGTNDPALTYAVTGGTSLQNGDSNGVFMGVLSRAQYGTLAGEQVGSYAITQGTISAGGNYTTTFTGANLRITPAALSITTNAQTKVYGTDDPVLTYTDSGLANGTVDGVTITDSLSGSLTRNQFGTLAGEQVGSYAITQGTISAGGNYTTTFTGASLSITPAALSITANAQTKVYGTNDPALTYTKAGLINAVTVDGVTINDMLSGGLVRVAGQNVGLYAINRGTLAPIDPANYTMAYTGANLTITPAALTIMARNTNKVVGTTYTFAGTEFTTAGLVRGDTVTSVTLASAGAPAAAALGPYAIAPSAAIGTGLSNYVVAYSDGTLTVIPVSVAPAPSSLPGPVIAVVTGTGNTPDPSVDQPPDAADGNGMSLRTVRNTSSIPTPINPCIALAAQDTLPNQMAGIMDLISISPELAETLPFYKTRTRSFDVAHVSCEQSSPLSEH